MESFTRRKIYKPQTIYNFLSKRMESLSQVGVQRFYYHYLVPGFKSYLDDFDLENLDTTFRTQCSMPRSLHVSSDYCGNIDICHRRVSIHHGFKYKIRYNAGVFETYSKKKDFRKAMKNGIYPTAVVRAVNLINANPYPYFSGEYDWYFTGGNLAHSKDFLIRATGKNMDILNISIVKPKRLKNILKFECNNSEENQPISEILEIGASNIKNEFIVRCEKNIAKYCYQDCTLDKQYDLSETSVPFITFSENCINENQVITGDLNRQVLLWDVNHSTITPLRKLISQKKNVFQRNDNWNCIRYHKNNLFAFTDFEKFGLIDIRMNPALADDIELINFSEEIGLCEKISSLTPSKMYENLIYIGTTHKLFGIDVRYFKKCSKNLCLLKWIHQMEYPPLMLKSRAFDEFELIAASSPMSGEIRFYEVEKSQSNKSEYKSSYLPMTPPDLLSNLNFAKLQGECLNPLVNIEARIKKCTTGIEFLEKHNKHQFFITNSIGDVFKSKITTDEDIEHTKKYNIDIIKNYYDAVDDISKKTSKELFVTDLKNMSNVSKILRCKSFNGRNRQTNFNANDNSENEDSLVNDSLTEALPKKRKRPKWEKTPSQYAQCKDVLASNILSIWEFPVDETKSTENDLLSVSNKIQETREDFNTTRIQSWIDNIENIKLEHFDVEELVEGERVSSKNTSKTERNIALETPLLESNQNIKKLIQPNHNSSPLKVPQQILEDRSINSKPKIENLSSKKKRRKQYETGF